MICWPQPPRSRRLGAGLLAGICVGLAVACTTPRGTPVGGEAAAPVRLPTSAPAAATVEPTTRGPAIQPTDRAVEDTSTPVGLDSGVVGGSLGAIWELADVRVGVHAESTRIVWEMAEQQAGAPRHEVALVEGAAGDVSIEVLLSDVGARNIALQDILPMQADSPAVSQVIMLDTQDDAILGFSVELKYSARFEVFTLDQPVRVVLDVLH